MCAEVAMSATGVSVAMSLMMGLTCPLPYYRSTGGSQHCPRCQQADPSEQECGLRSRWAQSQSDAASEAPLRLADAARLILGVGVDQYEELLLVSKAVSGAVVSKSANQIHAAKRQSAGMIVRP